MYATNSEERLTKAAKGDQKEDIESPKSMYRNRKKERLENWERKTLLGQCLIQTKYSRRWGKFYMQFTVY